MFIFLKPDADIRLWLDHLKPYGPLVCHPRQKSEAWAKRFYNHIIEEAVDRNAQFIASGWLIGVDLDIRCFRFNDVAKRLRGFRVTDPDHPEQNQIHVPDDREHSYEGRKLFL